MFVTVKYGDAQSKIFNSGCKNGILLESIKRQCQCQQSEVVELADERGVVKNLRKAPTDYASQTLKQRETLVLLAVRGSGRAADGTPQQDCQPDRPFFVPLLASLRHDTDFNDRLNQDKEPDTRDNGSSGRRQQLPSDTDEDAVSKSFKAKVRAINVSALGPVKKSILRKSTKSFARK